ncbi:MAG TPA: enolase C-terminal domain-like protein [Lacunisphaera sp.]|jgi:L-alanine-DL-glutamate epimerase-like enolase superfamily enzyme|nr:enolase C-terminal domain-like protein [Lacunisphaera sp.]
MLAAAVNRELPPVKAVRTAAFKIPTSTPESDGTLAWRATTLVVVEVTADGETGLGYTYADAGTARLIDDHLVELVTGRNAFGIDALWGDMWARLRNLGHQGGTAMAVSAVDTALWDLKARLLGVPLVQLLGPVRDSLPVYGSGGFTNYTDAQLAAQFQGWAAEGLTRFKMKVGREPARDPARVRAARRAIGPQAELFVDANSAYTRKQAVACAREFAGDFDVRWLEQPLPPEDFAGLRVVRDRAPAPLEIADGEYGYDLDYYRRLLAADVVDVVMADVTRCGGITGFLKIAALCEAACLPLSTHCAPALHVHPGCAARPVRHAEYFHDHVRIERELFAGVVRPEGGALRPDAGRPGHGLEFKWADALRYAA